jgi:hypothetical protein
MWTWFTAGGFGMFMVLAVGVAGIGYGAKTLADPTGERVAALRGMPAVIALVALFTFGVNVWAVNRALENDAFAAAHAAQLPVLGIVGLTEAAQVFTLGGALAAIVAAMAAAAASRHARATQERRA